MYELNHVINRQN